MQKAVEHQTHQNDTQASVADVPKLVHAGTAAQVTLGHSWDIDMYNKGQFNVCLSSLLEFLSGCSKALAGSPGFQCQNGEENTKEKGAFTIEGRLLCYWRILI